MLRPNLPTETRQRLPVGEAIILERPPAVIVVAWRDTEDRQRVDPHGVSW
jgi:hypothetical protein